MYLHSIEYDTFYINTVIHRKVERKDLQKYKYKFSEFIRFDADAQSFMNINLSENFGVRIVEFH